MSVPSPSRSLLAHLHFPVPQTRELGSKPLNGRHIFRSTSVQRPKLKRIPCKFPVIRKWRMRPVRLRLHPPPPVQRFRPSLRYWLRRPRLRGLCRLSLCRVASTSCKRQFSCRLWENVSGGSVSGSHRFDCEQATSANKC